MFFHNKIHNVNESALDTFKTTKELQYLHLISNYTLNNLKNKKKTFIFKQVIKIKYKITIILFKINITNNIRSLTLIALYLLLQTTFFYLFIYYLSY